MCNNNKIITQEIRYLENEMANRVSSELYMLRHMQMCSPHL